MKKQGFAGSVNIKERESYNSFREAVRKEWLPMALSIGLKNGEFWKLNPLKLEPYVRAHEIREKRRLEEINFGGWIAGVYVTYALGCAFSQNSRYPEKPFDLFEEGPPSEERSRQEANLFAAYADEFNRRFKKEEK